MPCTDPYKMAVMYEELLHCQKTSIGPNFVVRADPGYFVVIPFIALIHDTGHIVGAR